MRVIGDKNTVLGFRLIGGKGVEVYSAEEARTALEEALRDEELNLLMITENWADTMRERINQLKIESVKPLIIEIPGYQTEPRAMSLRRLVESAVGVKIGMDS